MNIRYKNLITVTLVFIGMMASAQATDLRIAAAANFTSTLKKLLVLYEEQSGHSTVVSAGSTGKLYAQIINGAPFDVFLAADSRRPQLLETQQLIVPGSRLTYAKGRLALWSASDILNGTNSFPDIDSIRYLAIANPRLAPYGAAAQQTLNSLGLWNIVQPKLVRGESANQAYQFVASGNANAGLIGASQLPAGIGSYWLIPEHLHQPLEQQLVVLNDRPSTAGFIAFMRGADAIKVMQENGYSVPGDPD